MDNKKMFSEWVLLNKQIAEMTAKANELKSQMVSIAVNEGIPEVEGGKFSLCVRKSWTYPEEIKEMELHLKENKKVAEKSGTATFEQTTFLMFKTDKSK